MTTFPTVDGLHIRTDGAVLRITLDRDDRRNALTDAMVSALIHAFETGENSDAIRVIALNSANDNFCSGFDLSERGRPTEPPRFGATQRRLRTDINRLIATMFECQTPIVAAVCGHAVGLGLALALAADFTVVADDAKLRAPFSAIGMTPDSGVAWMLPRLVGVARAKQMILLGQEVGGARAEEWGLVFRSVPSGEVETTAERLVQELANAATVAIGFAKDLIYRGMTVEFAAHLRSEAAALEMISRTDDFTEPRRAKREGRPAEFKGR